MQYNSFKARNLILCAVQHMAEPVIPYLWPILYLAERKHVANEGYWMMGDHFVAMQQGPVPLRTFTELYLKAGLWGKVRNTEHLSAWLRNLALREDSQMLAMSLRESERRSLQSALLETNAVGLSGLQKLVKGPAWQRAGPDGLLDPLEVAKEGGADAATLDFVFRWREVPYLIEASPGIGVY